MAELQPYGIVKICLISFLCRQHCPILYCTYPRLHTFQVATCFCHCSAKLVLHTDKTWCFQMQNQNHQTKSHFPQGTKIECVSNYRYLGILIGESLSFTPHIQQPVLQSGETGILFHNQILPFH